MSIKNIASYAKSVPVDIGLGKDLTEKQIKELIQAFQERLDDPSDKKIFNLHFIEGNTPQEIISTTSIPQATVYRKINELKRDFLDFLQQ